MGEQYIMLDKLGLDKMAINHPSVKCSLVNLMNYSNLYLNLLLFTSDETMMTM